MAPQVWEIEMLGTEGSDQEATARWADHPWFSSRPSAQTRVPAGRARLS